MNILQYHRQFKYQKVCQRFNVSITKDFKLFNMLNNEYGKYCYF